MELERRNKILPVDHDIEDLAEDKGTDVPTDKADKNLVTSKVKGSDKSSLAPGSVKKSERKENVSYLSSVR